MTYSKVLLCAGFIMVAACTSPPGRDPASAGCRVGASACAADRFCELAEGHCEADDATGTCAARPEVCTMEYAPVCGCDGTTYGNDCQRRSAGVSRRHAGECR